MKIKVEFSWVRGHSGIVGDKEADRLAKEVSRIGISEVVYDKIPRLHLRKSLEKEVFKNGTRFNRIHTPVITQNSSFKAFKAV